VIHAGVWTALNPLTDRHSGKTLTASCNVSDMKQQTGQVLNSFTRASWDSKPEHWCTKHTQIKISLFIPSIKDPYMQLEWSTSAFEMNIIDTTLWHPGPQEKGSKWGSRSTPPDLCDTTDAPPPEMSHHTHRASRYPEIWHGWVWESVTLVC